MSMRTKKRAIGCMMIAILAITVVTALCWNHGVFDRLVKGNKKVVATNVSDAQHRDGSVSAKNSAKAKKSQSVKKAQAEPKAETQAETQENLTLTEKDMSEYSKKCAKYGDDSFYDRYVSADGSAERTKYFSDAVSTGFKTSSDEEKQLELEKEIWHNPVMGHAVALMFRDLGEINGVVIAEENKWLKTFIDEYEKEGFSHFLVPDSELNLYVNEAYKETATSLIALLNKFKRVGVEKIDTFWHYPLKGSGWGAKAYRNTDENYVDKEESLNFVYKDKSGRLLVKFGFNLKDKRPEVFVNSGKPVEPTKPTKPTKPTIPTNPPTLKKNPYADPVHQGNANKGGGEGNGETKATPDADYTKAYSNDAKGGPDNSQGYSRPETVAPVEQPATETNVSTDQRIMDYGGNDDAIDSFGVGDEVVGVDSSYEDFLD